MEIIENNKSGHRYKLLQTAKDTNGERLEMEVTYPPKSQEPKAHYHPMQTEHFKLLSGELSVRMDGSVSVYREGDGFCVPPKTIHSMWNSGAGPTVVNWVVEPALSTEQFFRTMAELAYKREPNKKPGLLQTALTLRHFSKEFVLASPPAFFQRLLFGCLATIASLLGYNPVILSHQPMDNHIPINSPKPFSWPELLILVAIPTLLNFLACRLAIPFIDGLQIMPIEVAYFLSVGLLVLVPMFFGAIYLTGREIGSFKLRDVLARMRIKKIKGKDWLWTIGGFFGLSAASFLLAKILLPVIGWDSTPFFFQNMPLQAHQYWILAVWPLYFFFNIMGEELFWRGYILPRQTLLNGRWTWLVQGVLWACWHLPMGLDLVLTSLPILLILPAIAQIRNNSSISIVIHAIFGGFGFLALALGLVH